MATRWSLHRRIALRFAVPYVLLYCFSTIIALVPGLSHVPHADEAIWMVDPSRAVLRLARHFFHGLAQEPQKATGSGDTAFKWTLVGCALVAATTVCIVWSVLDRKRLAYPALADAVRTVLRYVLAATMLQYGLAKVFPLQFPNPDITHLTVRYADSSPMGLLWNFMGFSPAYVAFGGVLESAGAVLLLWRGTTALGALVLVGVLANVVMLNLCYDVPVKQHSAHLLLFALVLAAPDVPRLARVLVLSRPARPAPLRVPLPPWVERVRPFAKVLVVGFLLFDLVGYVQHGLVEMSARPMSLVYGVWNVESIEPRLPDDARWRQLVVNRWGGARAEWVNAETPTKGYKVEVDADRTTVAFTPQRGGDPFSLRYTRDGDHMELRGPLGGQDVIMRLHKLDETRLPLFARGFHWVQEQAYNR